MHSIDLRPVRAAIGAALGGAVLAGFLHVPVSAGERAVPATDLLAGWQTMADGDLADQTGGASTFSVEAGDLLVNQSDIAATVGQSTMTNVTAGGISNTTVAGLDGISTVVFNTGSAVSTAINYQLNVIVK